jgi:hypothetical protein
MRDISRASMVGTAIPVLDTITMASTSCGSMFAAASDGNLQVGVVGFSEPSQFRVTRQRQREAAMVDASRFGKAHEPRLGELGEPACHFSLVVPMRCESHCRAGDVRAALGMTSSLVSRCEIRCLGHNLTTNNVPSKVPESAYCVRRYIAGAATLCPTTTTATHTDGATGSAMA